MKSWWMPALGGLAVGVLLTVFVIPWVVFQWSPVSSMASMMRWMSQSSQGQQMWNVCTNWMQAYANGSTKS
ncbi:hypothetical protein GCM10010885_19590 [Alicyclobacillus cellulosilyticus]|uniref:Uncharacterized protein n=1 Tax=Alicyclobacillus cellulosilyticus TaxID=1003997 RepID=A0A917NLV1_9BACL|nr:hypothetical protein [Alicyclobacillus cellulosilyticus]GGJ10459.1 hypothetical protein GCM10010885_19590 [Alicyclobacillus cellulosilyticus]